MHRINYGTCYQRSDQSEHSWIAQVVQSLSSRPRSRVLKNICQEITCSIYRLSVLAAAGASSSSDSAACFSFSFTMLDLHGKLFKIVQSQ